MSYALPLRRRRPSAKERAISVAVLLALLLIGAGIGVLGLAMSFGAQFGWFAQTPRVTWAPPRGTLSSARAVISLAVAVAGWLVWRHRRDRRVGGALILFVTQAVLSTIWPVLFYAGYGVFGVADLWLTVALLLLLDLVLVATTVAFWSVSKAAGVILGVQMVVTLFTTSLVLGSASMHAVL